MLIEEKATSEQFDITGCVPGTIEINGEPYNEAVVLQGEFIGKPLKERAAELSAEDFFQTASSDEMLPEVILVGTGEKQVFLHPKIAAALAAKGIGLESMTTASACRTFKILQSEGRRVWAWLWP
ncbi:Mth938-like domain-containing protein [Neisseria animaloris]|uniref:Protein of uncharacterized function (DUF498/DUF598) n=1 Tax=Neisseria animaloris TaxID=326522 RepID=A0A448UAV3_9NEIS|nr:Mth938-like domain-containing protein [Neisseria animaloris]VEJ21011.1 Protein of uncharacterised function (DUF498/DUF598) [Neisseria animaloris]